MKLTRETVYPWDNAITEALYSMEGNEYYLKGVQDFYNKIKEMRLLPCKYQIDEEVDIFFGTDVPPMKCKVVKVHFNNPKVSYDLEYKIGDGLFTRLYNIDSAFIIK